MVEGDVAIINFSVTQQRPFYKSEQNIIQQSKLLALKAGHRAPSKTGRTVLEIGEAPTQEVPHQVPTTKPQIYSYLSAKFFSAVPGENRESKAQSGRKQRA